MPKLIKKSWTVTSFHACKLSKNVNKINGCDFLGQKNHHQKHLALPKSTMHLRLRTVKLLQKRSFHYNGWYYPPATG